MPDSRDFRRRSVPLWVKAIIFAIAYVLAGELGDILSVQRTFSSFWPPAGLFLGVLLISEREDWPTLIVAGFLGNLGSDLLHGRELLMAAGFAVASALEAVTGATLVGSLIGHRPRLDSLRQVLSFSVVGALLAPVVGATVGSAVVVLTVPDASWWTTWATWWIGDALSIILVGSLLLSSVGWWDLHRDDPARGRRRYYAPLWRSLAIAVPFSVLAYTVFMSAGGATSWKFLITPGYIAIAMVGGPLGAAVGLFLMACSAMGGMVVGAQLASLASGDIATRVFQAQAFFAIGGISALALAGVIAESRDNAAHAEAAAIQFRDLFDTMREGVAYCRMIFDASGQATDWVYLQVNEAFGELTGLTDVMGRHIWEVIPDLDETNPELFEVYGGVAKTGRPALFESYVAPLHRTLRISVTSPARGEFVAVFEDVSDRVQQERELAASAHRLEKMVYDVAEAMGSVVEARDPYTQGHEVRVCNLARRISDEMGLSDDERDEIAMSSLLHDIGKLRVPAEILTKPGQLSATEFALIKEHPEQGFEILGHIDFPWPVAEIVLQHHERLDGSGYPRGLKGDEIMLPARILAVADVVEAMASHRPYRPAVGLTEAIEEISTHPDRYDGSVVAAVVRLHERGETGL